MAAGGTRTFTFEFAGDTRGLSNALGDADRATSGFGSKMKGFAVGVAGAIAGAFVIDKLVDWGGQLADLGRQADQWEKKAAVVFGGQTASMAAWADSVNESFGLTEANVLGVSAGLADLLKPMGFTEQQAASMTQETVGLAGALSAWSAGQYDAAEVTDILADAMLGETDGLKALGISINAAEVQTRAMAIAQAEGRAEVTDMDAALATQQLVMEKSTDAQRAWTDGTMDNVQAQNELTARVDSGKEAIGRWVNDVRDRAVVFILDEVVPAFQAFGEWAGPKVTAALDGVKAWWDTNGPGITTFILDVRDRAVEMGEGFQDAWNGSIKPALDGLSGSLSSLAETLGLKTSDMNADVGSTGETWRTTGEDIGVVIGGIVTGIDAMVRATDAFVGAVTALPGGTYSGLDALRDLRDLANDVARAAERAYDAVSSLSNIASTSGIDFIRNGGRFNAPAPSAGGGRFSSGGGGNFRNHSGGVVPGAPGQPVLRLLEGGEMVRSRPQVAADARQGGAPVQVIVQGSIYGDGRAVIEQIERAVRSGQSAGWLRQAGVGA